VVGNWYRCCVPRPRYLTPVYNLGDGRYYFADNVLHLSDDGRLIFDDPWTQMPEANERFGGVSFWGGGEKLSSPVKTPPVTTQPAKGQPCTVTVQVQGDGLVVCEHGGVTPNWKGTSRIKTRGYQGGPLEVAWGEANVFNRGSVVVLEALPQKELGVGAPAVSKFSLDFCKSGSQGPLSPWERVRVRAIGRENGLPSLPDFTKPSPPAPLPEGEGSSLQKSSSAIGRACGPTWQASPYCG